jgi:hypothetical protein
MKTIVVFCEDAGHEQFLTALVERLAVTFGVSVKATTRSAGGHGRMLKALREYVDDLRRSAGVPDLLVVARDSNCRGIVETQNEIDECLKEFQTFAIYAIPNPHIERWLLLDSAAFRTVLGAGCEAPDEKCDRYRYKKILADAVRDAGVNPALGGIEYADDIVEAMDIDRMLTADSSLGTFLQEIRQQFRLWAAEQ